jgi:hypothetical protein
MLESYGNGTRQTLRILARAYCEGRFPITGAEIEEVVRHSEQFFRRLPLRMRIVVWVVLRLFELASFFVEPAGRSLGDKSVAEQRRAYERWFEGGGYVRAVLGQVLHMTFLGSVYSLPSVHAAIGYERVRGVR